MTTSLQDEHEIGQLIMVKDTPIDTVSEPFMLLDEWLTVERTPKDNYWQLGQENE